MSGVTVATTISSISSARDAFVSEQFFCSFRSQMRRSDARVGIVPFADAGARANPFVIRIHYLFEIGVRDDSGRNVSGHSGNLRGNASAHLRLQFSGNIAADIAASYIGARTVRDCMQMRTAVTSETPRH